VERDPFESRKASERRFETTQLTICGVAMTLKLQADLYQGVMNDPSLDLMVEGALFTVRLWDGMDGCWTDMDTGVLAEVALAVWNERTEGGTKKVSFIEIDYFRIFPADTQMAWDGTDGREMFRK